MKKANSSVRAIGPASSQPIICDEIHALARPSRFLRLPEVKNRVGVGRSTLYRWMEEGRFPRSVQLSQKCVVWRETDIDSWIASKG
jgi:prophage regulatory protein